MRFFSIIAATVSLATLVPAASFAQTPTTVAPVATPSGSAIDFIQKIATDALTSLSGQHLSDEETTQKFRTLLRQDFDLKVIGRFVLGSYFNSASPQQRQDYQTAFENMIVDAYAIRFRDYSGGTFKAGRETPQGKDFLVDSEIGQSNGAPPVKVTWRVRPEADGYKIIDVSVEGVSMGQTERSEFSSYIERNGGNIQALIDAMRSHKIGLQNQ